MTQEDSSNVLRLMVEQGKICSEIQAEINNWFQMLDILTKEFKEKTAWAHKHLNEAINRQRKENERYNDLFRQIYDKCKEENAGMSPRAVRDTTMSLLKHHGVSIQTPQYFNLNTPVF